MQPKRSEILSAAALVLFLVSLIVVIVYFAIPPEGAPTLQ
jgi:hypothetical protein